MLHCAASSGRLFIKAILMKHHRPGRCYLDFQPKWKQTATRLQCVWNSASSVRINNLQEMIGRVARRHDESYGETIEANACTL